MKAISDSTRNLPENHHLTRRQALRGTAATIAMPAGAMLAALPADAGMLDDSALIDATRINPDAFRRFAGLPAAADPHLLWQEEWSER